MEELTQSEENYLKAIYHLAKGEDNAVGTNDLASKLNTKASSITDMIRRLSEKDLVSYEKYKGCTLTPKGRLAALRTIRKHRLWETFLVEKLKFGWEEVHEIAEQLEHIRSVELTNRLDEFLNYPKFDPHGDPIPDSEGNIAYRDEIVLLSEMEVNETAVIMGVSDSSASFLNYLDRYKIGLGDKIKLVDKFEFDNSIEVFINEVLINLSSTIASKVKVKIELPNN